MYFVFRVVLIGNGVCVKTAFARGEPCYFRYVLKCGAEIFLGVFPATVGEAFILPRGVFSVDHPSGSDIGLQLQDYVSCIDWYFTVCCQFLTVFLSFEINFEWLREIWRLLKLFSVLED